MRCSIIPPYLLERLAALPADHRMATASRAARNALRDEDPVRAARAAAPRYPDFGSAAPADEDLRGLLPLSGGARRTISDADRLESLPGRVVRSEGQPATGDSAVDEAYAGLGATYALLDEVYGRDSIDGRGLPLSATVHYGREYDNAFWDGERMVFGDGDGEVFNRFTISLTVIGHELSHGLTQYTANLLYEGQSGALNESISDVFGVLVEQFSLGQSAAEASWLVGEELFTDQVQGGALRSLAAPGTAYDDDVLGRDPQPAHMDFYLQTTEDSGGVHINSGIPNRAFHLAATAIGGAAWDGAGRVWYDAVTAGSLSPASDFRDFAKATVQAAERRYGKSAPHAEAVLDAWRTVGIEP